MKVLLVFVVAGARSCVQLLATRLVAANIAEDVRRMVRHAGVPVFSVGNLQGSKFQVFGVESYISP